MSASMEIEKSQVDERSYKTLTLENGLQCLLISDPMTDKASAAMDVRVGHLSDPSHVPGLAHFLEHMLFLGTKKYPDENSYNLHLSNNGGSSNAFTDMESTNYFFDISHDFLETALDRFAQFFIAPLFTQAATDREMNAVESEHSKNIQNDMWRVFQLTKSLCDPEHPFSKFGSGNLQSLQIDGIRQELLNFHQKYYSANLMKLVVLGRNDIDVLESWVTTCFQAIPNQNLQPPSFPGTPFSAKHLAKRISLVPIHEQRSIDLHFPLREINTLYKSKPTRYISHLMGHEGAGSILSLLKHLGWANELSAGESRTCSDWSSFTVSVDLTQDGFDHINDVVNIIFYYLALLVKKGPQEWIHNETSTVADCNFRFLSKRPPMDYTSGLAGRMQLYAEEHYLSGPYKVFQYEPEQVVDILTKLVPSNMLLMASSKSFEGITDKVEKWYGTEYSIADVDENLLEKWSNIIISDDDDTENNPDSYLQKLSLPERNDMIATDFSLKEHSSTFSKDQPVLLQDTDTCRLWFKPDNVFGMPKVNVMAHLRTPVAYESPEAAVLAALWVQTLQEHCNEFTYLASMAGLHCDFQNARTGIEIHVSGYNHKVDILLERIVNTIQSLPDKLSDDLFERLKDKTQKDYQNFLFAQPYQHAFYGGDMVLEHKKWSMEDKQAALELITKADVMEFHKRLLTRFHCEVLVHGNVTPQGALGLASTLLENGLKPHAPFPSSMSTSNALRVVQLLQPPNSTRNEYVYRFPEFNEADTNSCVENVYQMGAMSLATNAALSLVAHLIKEPAFNELRTEEQLGYIVHTAVKTTGENVKGLLILIQSDGFDPIHLDERIEAFLERFRSKLASMPQEIFQANMDAVVKSFLEKNKSLGEESQKYWNVVMNRSYIFRKYALIAAEVVKLSKEIVLRFFDKFMLRDASHRQKLSCQVFSKAHLEKMHPEKCENGVVFVKDPVEFKRSMPLFPLVSTVNVESFKVEYNK